jgi:micrococcal nuclease
VIRAIAATLSLSIILASCSGSSGAPVVKPAASDLAGESAILVHAFDGDSMRVDIGGETVEVRLIGINAPEGDECYGDAARAALVDAIADRRLTLVGGVEDADDFGRLLRYVYVDGENVNAVMLAEASALTLQTEHPLADEFFDIGSRAAEEGIGMWAPDACGPPAQEGLEFTGVEYDPPGRDGEHLDEEYVRITNTGVDPIDLDGWTLRDESSHNRYRFDRLAMRSGATVTVRTGCGVDTEDTVFWCSDQPIWSNGGDTAILQDRNGTVAARRTYRP